MKLTATKHIPWAKPAGCPEGFETADVYLGRDGQPGLSPIEVVVARWTKKERLNRDTLAKLHGIRVNRRASPVVLVVELDDGSVLTFGPNPEAAPIAPLPAERAERVFQAVLDEPNSLLARQRFSSFQQAIDSTTIPGVKNSGLFANHELRAGVPQRADWLDACAASLPLLRERGTALIANLGYKTQTTGAHGLVLSSTGPHPHAVAVLLDERETFDSNSARFAVSPVAYGLRMAEQHGVPWLMLARGSQLRLYPARIDLGVGRKGLAETFLEVDLPQLSADNAGYLSLIFSAAALAEGGSAFQIMASSAQFAVKLGKRLRDKVYDEIVPELSVAVGTQLQEQGYEMDAAGLDLAYQVTLRVFFRLLFQVYAEDRKLLPYGESAKYDRNALKTVAKDLVENPEQEFDPESTSLWDDLAQVWRVIDRGDKAWGVPAYNGGLFTSDKDTNEHGAIIKNLAITNDVMGPVLKALLLDDDEDGTAGPIDFRSLSVREFGTIYEGLLESSLGLAEVDLTIDDNDTWVPAKKKDHVYAYAGDVYFHNTSGQRKGTGSYFTPSFVVEHLLERSLDPALDDHLAKVAELLQKGDQAGAGELFFDFRVADLAMGSGHFLTAAIDHIEAKMAAFLAEDGHQVPGVTKELLLLFQAAKDAVGPDSPEPEPSSLLRRQIARRCIYGLDINPIAVELARVSIWIHTFVRGLPMSSLDHNLVCANSLTGIGSIEEALDVLVPGRKGALTLFDAPIEDALYAARTVLVDVALMPELNRAETQEAAKAVKKARKEAETAKLLFDAAVLKRIGRGGLVAEVDPERIAKAAAKDEAQEALEPLNPAHMPVLFPEVFLRDNGGFDVLVGNPPWETVKVETHKWWSQRFPGLMAMPTAVRDDAIAKCRKSRPDLQNEYEAEVTRVHGLRLAVQSLGYPGLGTGDVDLYEVFAWRMRDALRRHGRLGVVFPRSLLASGGTSKWRKATLDAGELVEVAVLSNTKRWAFDMEARYTIALVVLERNASRPSFGISGPFETMAAFIEERGRPIEIPMSGPTAWTPTSMVPLIPDVSMRDALLQMYVAGAGLMSTSHPWEVSTYNELHSTKEKPYIVQAERPTTRMWPVYKGESIQVWNPDTGIYYGWADRDRVVTEFLMAKRPRQSRTSTSAYFGMSDKWFEDPKTLPCMGPRVAWRKIARATDTRTVHVALLPPHVFVADHCYLMFFKRSEVGDDAYVLGCMSSLLCDWVARRLVEVNLTAEILTAFPLPIAERMDQRRQRVVEIAARLAAIDDRFAKWAANVGVETGSVKTDSERADLMAELDALVAHLYGLSRDQVDHIFATFHRGWDYKPRLAAVLAHFDRIGKK